VDAVESVMGRIVNGKGMICLPVTER
jgi:hypothetical protein